MNIFWLRRDLRLEDNVALAEALKNGETQCVFIFDKLILNQLEEDDARLNFIHETLLELNEKLKILGSSIKTYFGEPIEIWKQIIKEFEVENVYANKDYEPYAIERDLKVKEQLYVKGVGFSTFKDQVIFEENEVLKDDGKPYTVFTPYKRKWLSRLNGIEKVDSLVNKNNFSKSDFSILKLSELGFKSSDIKVKPFTYNDIDAYNLNRDFPARDKTSYLSPHLRFGTISVRTCVLKALTLNETFLSELIWREFFMQILFHFPKVTKGCFKAKYDGIEWRNNEQEFEVWCKGETGYPMVDAGMRQLNETGYMHNRVRMVVASFLIKHLLIDWRWGEAYFAQKLLDFDLSANNGNWQWAAGTGCDSAPYFRIFNPTSQLQRFDKDLVYTRTWVKDFDELSYPQPMVDHKMARERCLETYKKVV
jgi:deoxyribodipyrimidine photo-lyase